MKYVGIILFIMACFLYVKRDRGIELVEKSNNLVYNGDSLMNDLTDSDKSVAERVEKIKNKVISLNAEVKVLKATIKTLENENGILKKVISGYRNEQSEPVKFLPIEGDKK